MATHLDDEAELEQLKTWWKENWVALVAGLGIGFGAIGGWEAYKHWRDGRAEAASQMYEEMKKALTATRTEDAGKILERLKAEYSGTPYASAAALTVAQNAVKTGSFDDAAAQLSWVIEHADDSGLVQMAKLRRARVLFALAKHDEALSQLSGDAGTFAGLYEELRGDIQMAKGDRDAARAAYEKALAAGEAGAPNRSLLQQKLDDLAVAAKS